ncbi:MULTISPECIES: C40 family peptidase [Rhodanobacter]|uniref:C40 family peptidase n=1 Tax=Rhodanobacter TaxID=75309 RepID=UPI0003F7AEDB|nr:MULTISPECIES: C40 family peptidase [Rhodanobacter]KZC19856.1 hydrolase [Rhodanobacter denitrificans]UJJ52162.1 C40 family peptidase [Rhodanobacter denitrificans]UJM94909.1 C40 family peptidase [Rhodanobacter denitrificans]UJM98439.1 C40 family peptidase [Rhodanobacter denitrificans]UJN22148.1 C40 family peptidase [Rhodanobacter denitrificans]
MPIKPLTAAAALVFVLLASGPLQAKSLPASPAAGSTPAATLDSPLPVQLPILDPATALARSVLPDAASLQAPAQPLADAADEQDAATAAASANITDLRKSLIAMAMKLRDTRYVRGGRDPSTGFDCSGFVRYVFAHAVGMQLPRNSASQFLAGLKVNRADMQPGDLVFFRTHGKRRISHVGIYISNGRFIHSPASGKSVEISSLNEGYWAKRFAGAKRPEAMAQVVDKG